MSYSELPGNYSFFITYQKQLLFQYITESLELNEFIFIKNENQQNEKILIFWIDVPIGKSKKRHEFFIAFEIKTKTRVGSMVVSMLRFLF